MCMKLKFLGLLPALVLALASCSDDSPYSGNGFGRIEATVNADATVTPSSALSRSGETTAMSADVSAFKVEIAKKDGTFSKTWESVAAMDPETQYPTGAYTINVSYGDENAEGFEKPYYFGSTEFVVVDEETAQPAVTATLCNTMLSIDYTDAFKKYFSDYSATIHSAGGAYIEYEKDEFRPVYVQPGDIALELNVTKAEDGKSFKFNPADITGAKPRTHYSVKFDVNGGEVGDAVLTVSFDSTTETEPIEVVLSEELVNAPAPTIKPLGFASGDVFNIIEGETFSESPRVNILAHAGIESVTLTVNSAYLASKGWPTEIDLLQATAAQQALFTADGLKVTGLWKNPDKMAQIDFGGLIASLRDYNGNQNHEFSIQVKDKFTKLSDVVTFKATTEPLQLVLSNPGTLALGQNTATATLDYNGGNVNDNVKIQIINEYGVWADANVTGITSAGDRKYTVAISIPASNDNITIRAIYKGETTSNTLKILRDCPAYTITVDALDVFAKRATIKVVPEDASRLADIMNYLTIETKQGSGVFAEVAAANVTRNATAGTILLKNLTPSTAYSVRTALADYSNTVTFTTEADQQLANSNMDSWYVKSKGNYWTNYVCGVNGQTLVWGTLNDLTTGSGVDAYYTRPWSTSSTTDSHTGTAALIRTVGYGSGTTGAGSISIVPNTTQGELYTGTYSGGPQYGVAFPSRPDALTFWYKYTAQTKVSGDYGVAYVKVYNAAGTVIATNSFNITSTGSYTKKTLDLNYTVRAKAAKIEVVFKSSGNSDCIKRAGLNLVGPSNSTGHQGSQLYIDDVTLDYK